LKKIPFPSSIKFLTRTLLSASIMMSLASCGGGTENASNAAGAPTTLAATVATESWIDCAVEGAQCSFSGTQKVRYGANGTYFYQTATNSTPCTNGVFGDPLPTVIKACAYASAAAPNVTAAAAPDVTAEPVAAPVPTTVLPIPTNIANGATVSLQCGQTYQGTLELNGKSNITVSTNGTCGKASITPGRAISGWTKYQGNIYSAPIGFAPVQVSVAGKPVDAAHWPNQPQMWANNTASIPNSDLTGATLVYLENQSVVLTQLLTSNSASTSKPFYVEGKLWMLDSPGEWAVSNDRLYLWAADGQSPEGRVWAASNGNGINADNSSGITVDGVNIFSAVDGISANTSTNLKVLNSNIANSARDGIWASGSHGLTIDKTNISNARRNGIDGWYSIVGATITNSSVTNTGMVGKPSTSDAGIMFGDGSDNRIDNVRVTNSSYHGISVLHNRNTSVTNSVVDTACVQLTDCAGIYTGARDQLPLSLRIEANTVKNVKGTEGIGIYLDDFANGVTVSKNIVSNNTRGMVMHNAFDNVVTANTFASNAITHLGFGQDNGKIRNNRVTNNTFKSTNNEVTFNLETGSNLKTFGTFDYNTYTSTNAGVFGRTWDGSSPGVSTSYSAWKGWMGQDAYSTMNGSK
jgi:parallel beta-helix repeat protein